jgi:chaperone BCS1
LEFLTNIFNTIQGNQLLAAGLGLSGAGIITFWIKDVPRSVYKFLKRELTTELIVTSSNLVFHNILKWIEKNYGNKNFRKLKLTNGRWGYNDNATTSIGYGLHYVRYNGHFFLFDLVKETSNQTEQDRETLYITKLGRSRKVFDGFIKEIETLDLDFTKTKVYKMEDSWTYIKDQQKRSFDSIFIEKAKKDLLISSLIKFIDSEQWYIDNGIPYQLGILLYGAPGTGKTSLIKAIAGYLNYPIYYLSPQDLDKIENAMSKISDKSILVIEDIDSNFVTHSRANGSLPKSNSLIDKFASISLSEVLNSLDGMFSTHGRILVTTTNHIENLDAALIRPGRIDLKIEIGYVNKEMLKDFINHFFPNYSIDIDKINIKNNITIAMLQNIVLQGGDGKDIERIVHYQE